MRRTETRLTRKLNRKPVPVELAEAMKIPVNKVYNLQKISRETISLSTPVGEDDNDLLEDFVADTKITDPETESQADDQNKFWLLVAKALRCDNGGRIFSIIKQRNEGEDFAKIMDRLGIAKLTRQERQFYILARRGYSTLDEIGRELNLTRERIRQLEQFSVKKLRAPKWKEVFKEFNN